MIRHSVAALVCGSWLAAVAVPASAFTSIEECQRWMDQLRSSTDQVAITGGDDERQKLLEQVDEARGEGERAKLKESIDKLKRFQDRAAALAAQGKVSRTDGQQLGNLSETVRRCLEAAERSESSPGAD